MALHRSDFGLEADSIIEVVIAGKSFDFREDLISLGKTLGPLHIGMESIHERIELRSDGVRAD